MSKMEIAIIFSYLLMTSYFFINWLRFTLRHPSDSAGDKFLSFTMFFITTVLWPFVIPMSCLEILKTRKLELSTVAPVVIAVFAVSVSFYLG
jgi:hypothetical protein